MKKINNAISLFISVVFFASCGGSGKNQAETAQQDSTNVKTPTDSLKNMVVYNIPSPIETFTLLRTSVPSFDKSLTNPIGNTNKYNSTFQKAVNLGVYSADLSFCFLYKQNQDFNSYLKNVNELTTALGIDGSYGQAVTKRLQDNSNNMDSLMQIANEASVNADLYLKENQRSNTTALMATGAWIETMHIIANVADKTAKKEIVDMVAQQKSALKNLVKMLEQLPADADITVVIKDIKEIAGVFETLQAQKAPIVTASADNAIPSVGNNTSIELTKEQLRSIVEKVDALRNKLAN